MILIPNGADLVLRFFYFTDKRFFFILNIAQIDAFHICLYLSAGCFFIAFCEFSCLFPKPFPICFQYALFLMVNSFHIGKGIRFCLCFGFLDIKGNAE